MCIVLQGGERERQRQREGEREGRRERGREGGSEGETCAQLWIYTCTYALCLCEGLPLSGLYLILIWAQHHLVSESWNVLMVRPDSQRLGQMLG